MAEVTYSWRPPFVAADDGIAAGEPTECFNPNCGCDACGSLVAQAGTYWSGCLQPDRRSSNWRLRLCKGHQKFGGVPDDLGAL